MRAIVLFTILIYMMILCVGCEQTDSVDPTNAAPDQFDDDQADDDDDDQTTPRPDDDDSPDPTPEPVNKYRFDLEMEIRGGAVLEFTEDKGLLSGKFSALTGSDIITAGNTLSGNGSIRAMEGGLRLYAFKFDGPSVADGPCENKRISYSATLMAKDENNYFSGGLTAYCGDNTYFGKPARVYRISGNLSQIEN